MSKKIAFSSRLRNVREMSGLSQLELSQRSGLDPTAISHMEAGRREPNLESLIKIVKALGVSADLLLGTARP